MTRGSLIMAAWTVSEPLANPARAVGDVMRALRLSLTGPVIVVLLGGMGSTAIAQAESMPGSPTELTGSMECVRAPLNSTLGAH